MKKLIIVLTGAIILAATTGLLAATIAPTVNVTGTVQGKCTVGTSPGDMAFTIDPTAAGPITATVGTQPTMKCTKNHPYTVACTSLNSFNLKQGSDLIPYTFDCPLAGSGAGFGAAGTITLTIGGSMISSDYEDAVVGSGYTDTVTITITY